MLMLAEWNRVLRVFALTSGAAFIHDALAAPLARVCAAHPTGSRQSAFEVGGAGAGVWR